MNKKVLPAILAIAVAIGVATVGAAAVPASAATSRPTSVNETGYTACWTEYPQLPGIDPYDERTWPPGAICLPSEDHRAPSTAKLTATNVDTAISVTATASSADDGTAPNMPVPPVLKVAPGQSVNVVYDMSVTIPAPDMKPIIGTDGQPLHRDIPSINFRSRPIAWAQSDVFANASRYGISSSRSSCDEVTLTDVGAQTAHWQCTVDFTVDPDFVMQPWDVTAGLGMTVQPDAPFQLQTIYSEAGGGAGPWSLYGFASVAFTAQIEPSAAVTPVPVTPIPVTPTPEPVVSRAPASPTPTPAPAEAAPAPVPHLPVVSG